jgi:hypothetical protein
MPIEYLVGVITKPDGMSDFLWQNNNLGIDADDYEAKDENGNVKQTDRRNYRLTGELNALVPVKTKIPVKGEVIELTGIDLPTVDAQGNVTGDFKINPDSTNKIKVLVNGTSNVTQNNQGYQEVTLSVIRYLVNGIPASGSSSSAS